MRLFIAGAGAWGSALAQSFATAGCETILWGRSEARLAEMARQRSSARLPGIALSPRIVISADAGRIAQAETMLLACPAQELRSVALMLAEFLPEGLPVVLCAKGIEAATGQTMSELAAEALPRARLAVLSGPSFAGEVARGLPAALTLAARPPGLAVELAAALSHGALRLYSTEDVTGVEAGGTMKNVIAIAAGIVHGLALGENARAAIVTRGFAEMLRFGMSCGADRATMTGLSGLGDLLLSAGSLNSRNFAAGVGLARGPLAADAPLAEGLASAAAVVRKGVALGLELPVAAAVADIVAGRLPSANAAEVLLARPLRAENGG